MISPALTMMVMMKSKTSVGSVPPPWHRQSIPSFAERVVEGSTGNHSSEALDYAGARTLGPDRAHALFE
jgi:hypothetical protein